MSDGFGEPDAGFAPPHDLDAEASVLSAIILDPKRISAVDFLMPEHFYGEPHRLIWAAARALNDEGTAIDAVTIGSRLKEQKRLTQAGGMPYIAEVLGAAPVIQNVRTYATTVYERWRLRQTILAAQQIVASGYADSITEVQSFVDEGVRALAKIGRLNPKADVETNAQLCRRLVSQMSAASTLTAEDALARSPGLMTGVGSIDRQTLGIKPGEKVTLMAERGRGKSTLALQAAMHVAGFRGIGAPLAEKRGGVLFFSTEMSRDEIGDKQLAHAARVDSKLVSAARDKPVLDAEEWKRVIAALALTEQLPITIDDRPGLTIDKVVAATKEAVERSMAVDGVPIVLVVVDYVQRLACPEHLQRKRQDEQIGYATRALKDLAREIGVAVLELAAMNAPDPRESKSGAPYEGLAKFCKLIESESNRVWCIWRPDRKTKDSVRFTSTKERAGEEFDLTLRFEPQYGRFFDEESERPRLSGIDEWDQ